MALVRKYKKDDPNVGNFRDSRLFVIVAEGTRTEELYFNNLSWGSRRVKVLSLKPEDISHGPQFVVERIENYEKRKGIKSDIDENYPDIIWVVYDRDPLTWDIEDLVMLAKECKLHGWGWAFSNPCFELWLLLHETDPEQVYTMCQPMKKIVGDRTNGCYLDIKQHDKLMADVENAIIRAEKLDVNTANLIPDPNCTRVYLLAKQMLQFMKGKTVL